MAVSLLAFSYENIIFSLSSMPYSIGVTSAIILILLFYINITKYDQNYFSCILNSIIILILSSSHYQIIFLLPAYYLTIFFSSFKRRDLLFKYIFESFLSLILIIFFILPFINLNWSGADMYTRGTNNEFYFILPDSSFFIILKYLFFFI